MGIVPVIETVSVVTGAKGIIAMNVVDGCWTADGKLFVAVTVPEKEKTLGQIITIDLATEKVSILVEAGASPCISPDGNAVIYTDGKSLFRAPLAGGVPERLPVEGRMWNPRCSRNSVWILGTGNADGEDARSWVKAFNPLTGKTRDIQNLQSWSAEMGFWSPSGKQYCYTRSALEGNAGSTIWIADFPPESGGSPASVKEEVPSPFKLIGNYPNPFNPSTTIEFSLPSDGKAGLAVYNMAGQKVRELVLEQLTAGKHAVVWNGRDNEGKPVSSGVYIARLKMEGKVESHRMTLVK